MLGLDVEFGVKNSSSAQAIERGIRVAIEEVNQAGGLLNGRSLVLETRDNRSVPARAVKNLRELAQQTNLVAVFVGRFSPAVIETSPVAEALGVILLDPWAAADKIIDDKRVGSYVFRLSLNDSLAMQAMLAHARNKRVPKVGLMVPRTAWGRSSLAALEHELSLRNDPLLVETVWYNWGDKSLLPGYKTLLAQGAKALILVANEAEGSILIRELARLLPDERMSIISHWGVTGGDFARLTTGALHQLDFSVVQTFSLFRADPERVERVLTVSGRLFGLRRPENIESPVGFGHAYDMTHILARAIELAGTTERAAVRSALEQVRDYHGLVRYYDRPFAPQRHEALSPQDVFMARFDETGVIVPLELEPEAAGTNSVHHRPSR